MRRRRRSFGGFNGVTSLIKILLHSRGVFTAEPLMQTGYSCIGFCPLSYMHTPLYSPSFLHSLFLFFFFFFNAARTRKNFYASSLFDGKTRTGKNWVFFSFLSFSFFYCARARSNGETLQLL